MIWNYRWLGYGLEIETPSGSCFMQGDEANKLYDQLEACATWAQTMLILSAYTEVCTPHKGVDHVGDQNKA